MVQAGLLDDGMSYGFKETNGKLPLMQGVKAYILVLGEDSKRGQLQFGITSFTTSISQKIEVNITPTDSASLRLLIDNLQLRDTKIEMQNDSLQPRRASLKQQIIELRKELDEGCKCYNSSNGIYEETSIDRDSLDF
jgi:hypothetical protein